MNDKLSSKITSFMLALALAGVCVGAAFGQQSRSVVIANGAVTLDGQRLQDDAVPESLREFDGNVSFSFSGDEEPLIGFGTRTYRIEGDRIVEVPSPAQGFSFPGDASARAFTLRFRADSLHEHATRALSSSMEAMRMSMPQFDFDQERLARHLDSIHVMIPQFDIDEEQFEREMEELQSSLGALKNLQVPDAALHFRQHSPPGRAFRPLDLDVYLEEIRAMDHDLYEQLLNERELEDESLDLARRIQEAEAEQERQALVQELREHLNEAFELRQENRREEIRKLERKMDTLRKRVETRESMRERIIENRIEDLLGDE